jgi:hypothetical protein
MVETTEEPWLDSWQGQEDFLFSYQLIQTPIQWNTPDSFSGRKASGA